MNECLMIDNKIHIFLFIYHFFFYLFYLFYPFLLIDLTPLSKKLNQEK